MPLAIDAGAITRIAKNLRNRDFVAVHHRPTDISINAPRAVVVPTRHETGASWGANWTDIELAEHAAPLVHRVEFRCADYLITKEAVVTTALIVTHDDNYIGSRCLQWGCKTSETKRIKKQREETMFEVLMCHVVKKNQVNDVLCE